MKKCSTIVLVFLSVMFAINASADEITDSLWRVIRNDTTSPEIRLRTYKALTDVLMKQDLDSCRKVIDVALKYANQHKKYNHESVFTTLLGVTHYYQGEYQITASYWLKALDISEKAKDTPRIEQVLNNLGILYKTIEEYDLAKHYFTRALELKRREGNPSKIAITEMNIGVMYHKMLQHDSAYYYLTKALPVLESGKDFKALAMIYNNLGSVHMARKEFETAFQYYTKGYQLLDYLPSYEQAMLLMNTGRLLMLHLNRPEEGKKYLEKSIEIARKHNNLRAFQRIYETYSDYYIQRGDFKKAYEYHELRDIYKDSLFTVEKEKQIKELQARFDIEKKEEEMNRKVELEKLQRLRQQRAANFMFVVTLVTTIVLVIIVYLFIKVRNSRSALEKIREALQKSNEQLAEAKSATERALQFRSQFLANMSHEVRTPLNVIIGFNSQLKRKISDPKLLEYIDAIEISSFNLLSLINDILDMSSLEAGKTKLNLSNVNLKSLINEIWLSFSLKAEEKGLDFQYYYNSSLPEYFLLDSIIIRQILMNLVGNAFKFTHAGSIMIVVRQDSSSDQAFASSLYNLCIDVIDTGIGITPEDQNIIFEAFAQSSRTTKSTYGGTGLGLAISKQLAILHGGDLTVASTPDKGSTFTLHLRQIAVGNADASSDFLTRSLQIPQDLKFTGGTLLFADDEELNQKMIHAFFEESSVKVVTVSNGSELVEVARQLKPTVILTDIKMPVMDGIEAARIIKSDNDLKDIPIIAFTASVDFPKLNPEIRKLFDTCINKPVDINEIYQRLSFYLPVKVTTEVISNWH